MANFEPSSLSDALEFIETMFRRHFELNTGDRVIDVYEDVTSSKLILITPNEFGYTMIKNDPGQMVELAGNDAPWFYHLEQGIYYADTNGYPVPQIIRKFYAPYLNGSVQKPKIKPGPKPDIEFQWVVRYALLILKNLGVSPTKNQVRAANNTSKCGVDHLESILKNLGRKHISASSKLQDLWYKSLRKHPLINC